MISMKCRTKGCPKAARARGLCTTCYGRVRRNGGFAQPVKVVRFEEELPLRDSAPVATRVSKARSLLLKREARRLGLRTLERLTWRILEDWSPPRGPRYPERRRR